MRIPINKLLILGFLGYLSYEIYTIYLFCQPPLAESGGAAWDLKDSEPLDLCLFLSKSEKQPPRLPPLPAAPPSSGSHFFVGDFREVNAAGSASRPDLQVRNLILPTHILGNHTIYLHVVAVPHARRGDPVRHEAVKISRYVLQADRKVQKRYLLREAEPTEPIEPAKPVTSLPRVVEVGFVQETRALDRAALADKGLSSYLRGDEIRLPLFVNSLVSPRDEYTPLLKEGVDSVYSQTDGLDLEFRLRNVGLAYWTMQLQIILSFDEAEKTMGMNEYDIDSFKQLIGGSSPYKILIVYGVSILHLIFEYLAFASDITFWRQKTSFEGLSSTSVALQACMNIIMFFYVQEQRQTKFVLYFIGFRFSLQLWKLRKLTEFRRSKSWPFFKWVNRAGASENLEELEGVDDADTGCMKWLMLLLTPVIVGFSLYRLVTQPFRSWYSWLVLSLAICAQTGGFVVMTPQVFMNYRLKSVEHLPWKALTYQAINTFIDDIFMLCIRMPEIQKYSVFRDDIIFVIMCVQRWLYRKRELASGEPQPEKAKDE